MQPIHKTRGRWALGPIVVLAIALSLALALSSALAAEMPSDTASVTAPAGNDDGYLEVGVEWVEYYSYAGNLPATEPDALGLRNQLRAAGWTSRFAWGNSNAWEQDWKGWYKTGGGKENYYVDNVDLAYFAGHGSSSQLYFGSTVDDRYLTYSDCRLEWGDKDAEWIGLAACNVLADSHRTDWSWCMDGLHLLMGFKTTMADVPHGLYFGWYLRNGYNMTQAWFRAADALQPQGKIARVLAEEYHHFWDRPYNHNSSDAMNYATYFYWTHTVGSEPARQVDIDLLQGTMPVFFTPGLDLDAGEDDALWEQLGTAFGVETDTPMVAGLSAADPIWMSADGQLEMDGTQGLFAYTELNSLWVTPTVASAATIQLSEQNAKDIADQFLADSGLMPGDAQYYEVLADTMTAATNPARVSGRHAVAADLQASEAVTTTGYQVIYSRILTATVPGIRGPQEVEFSVVGPGAKLKVYVAPTVSAGLKGKDVLAEAVVGGMGGWRGAGQSTRAVHAEVTVLTYGQIGKLFEELEPTVALDYVPVVFESREVLSHTVAYYELPIGTGQAELIPVYVLDVEYDLGAGEVVTSPAYIPVNEEYMAPLALIESITPIPSTAGEWKLRFEAADASANLSDLGFDSSLDFAIGTGDEDSYLYEWYLDSISDANKLGAGSVLTYTATYTGSHGEGGGLAPRTIILQVTDALSTQPPSVSTDTYEVLPPVFLPLVLRN